MSTLGIILTVIGACMIGAGLGLAVLVAWNRREMTRRADAAKRTRVPFVKHYGP